MKKDRIIAKYRELALFLEDHSEQLSKADWDRHKQFWDDLAALEAEPDDCYPEEFVEWLVYGNHPFVVWFDEKGHYYTDEISKKRWSIPELFNHWQAPL